jgi:hypothetical protein
MNSQSQAPTKSYQSPPNVDMNKPMDKNTMDMMMNMMNSFQQQMSPQQPGAQNNNGGQSNKGLFD